MARYIGRHTDTLHIRLEPELKAELNQLAATEHCSAGELVRRLLSTGLAAYGERPAHELKHRRRPPGRDDPATHRRHGPGLG